METERDKSFIQSFYRKQVVIYYVFYRSASTTSYKYKYK